MRHNRGGKKFFAVNFYNYQVLAWLDGGWEGNALSEEEPDFIVCSASGDGEDMLVIGVAMEQEDAILTCKVFKGKCKIIFFLPFPMHCNVKLLFC